MALCGSLHQGCASPGRAPGPLVGSWQPPKARPPATQPGRADSSAETPTTGLREDAAASPTCACAGRAACGNRSPFLGAAGGAEGGGAGRGAYISQSASGKGAGREGPPGGASGWGGACGAGLARRGAAAALRRRCGRAGGPSRLQALHLRTRASGCRPAPATRLRTAAEMSAGECAGNRGLPELDRGAARAGMPAPADGKPPRSCSRLALQGLCSVAGQARPPSPSLSLRPGVRGPLSPSAAPPGCAGLPGRQRSFAFLPGVRGHSRVRAKGARLP